MVYLDVSIVGVLCGEGRADLEEGAREDTGDVSGTVRQSRTSRIPTVFWSLPGSHPGANETPSALRFRVHRVAANQNNSIHLLGVVMLSVWRWEASPHDRHSVTAHLSQPASLGSQKTGCPAGEAPGTQLQLFCSCLSWKHLLCTQSPKQRGVGCRSDLLMRVAPRVRSPGGG